MAYEDFVNTPYFRNLPPERQRAILENAGMAPGAGLPMSIVGSTPGPSAAPTAVPMAPPAGPAPASGPPSFGGLDPRSWESGSSRQARTQGTEQALASVKNTLGNWSNKVAGPTVGPWVNPGQLVPGSVPEIVGDVAMAAGGGLPYGLRMITPALAAAGSSYLSGSRVGPLHSALVAGAGTLGQLGTEMGGEWIRGRAKSKAVSNALSSTLSELGQKMNAHLPQVVKRPLKDAADFLEYFGIPPEDRWRPILNDVDRYHAQALAEAKKYANMPANFKNYYQRTKVQPLLDKAAKRMQEFEDLAKPYGVLRKYFGNPESFKVEGYQDRLLNGSSAQDYLDSAVTNQAMRDAGIPQKTINALRRTVHGAPGAQPNKIMKQVDTEARKSEASLRGHIYSGIPTLSSAMHLPELAKLAGNRQKALEPNKLWGLISGGLMDRLGYGITDYSDQYTEPATDKNTTMPSGATGEY